MPVLCFGHALPIDHDLQSRSIPNDRGFAMQTHGDLRYRLPEQVVESARLDTTEILALGKCFAARIDQLEFLRMQLAGPLHIRLDESAKALALELAQGIRFVFACERNAAAHEKSEREDQSAIKTIGGHVRPLLELLFQAA